MQNNKPLFISKSIIKWVCIPTILLFLGIGLWVLFGSNTNFSILTYPHHISDFTLNQTTELLKGEKISGSFTADENNLGIIAVRFNTFNRINKDRVTFRIKKTGTKDWYYTQTYKVDQFQPNAFFTFGFPVISDSKGKQFLFEIQSTKGKHKDAVALSTTEPVFLAEYQFPKSELLQNKKEAVFFLFKRVTNVFREEAFFSSSLEFFLPLLFYLFWILQLKRYRIVKIALLMVFIFLLIYLIFSASDFSPGLLLGLVGFWILIVGVYTIDSSVSFSMSMLFLVLSPFLLIMAQGKLAERIAQLAYIFLLIGGLELLWEFVWKPTNLLSFIGIVDSFSILNKK